MIEDRLQRDLGRLEAGQEMHATRLDRIEEKLDRLIDQVSSTKGGFRMLLAVGSIAAALGAATAQILHMLHGGPR